MVDETARAGTFWLTLTGGEPFLHPGFDLIYERAIRAGMLVTLFTNGTSLTRERVTWLSRRPPRNMEATLYGFSRRSYARVTGRAQNFDRARDGIRRAVAAGLSVQVKCMVFDETIEDLEAIRDFAAALGQSFRFDTLLHSTLGGSAEPGRHRLGVERALALETTLPAASGRVECEGAPSRQLFRCGAGRYAYLVAPDGALQLCTLLRKTRVDLARTSFLDAWRRLQRQTRRKYPARAKCGRCEVRTECAICPGLAEVESGHDTAAPQHLCAAARHKAMMRAPRALVGD
ncbi:MAG: radical SAM protein [Myxococcales bacterium]